MTQPRGTTRFSGSTSLHFVTFTSPLARDPKLISNNMAAVLAMFDGLTLVCSASTSADKSASAPCSSADVDMRRDPD